MKRFVRMDPRLSRSMPLLQPPGCSFPLIYRVISPRWPERRMYTPRHYYINGVRTKLIGADSYSNPTRSPKRLILCGASGPHAGKITRSSSTAELSRAGVYCSTEDLRDHGRVSRRAASCEDVYRTTSIPGTPGWDSRFSESGVSLNDSRTTLGSLVCTDDVDGVSQCSFGSSSAFHEVTNDSELDRPDSDSFSVPGSLCGHDRALDVVHEGNGPYSCFGSDRTAHRKTRHDSGSRDTFPAEPWSSGRSSPDDRREFYHSTPTKRGSPVLSIFPGEEEDLHFPSHVSNDSLHPDSSNLSRDSLPSPRSPRSPSSPSASQRKEKAGTKTGRQDDSNNYRSAESIPASVDTTRRALDRKRRDFFSSLQDCSKLEEQSPGESVQSWITTGHTQRRSAFTDLKSLNSNEDSPRQQEVLRSSGSAARTSVRDRVAAIEQGPSLKIPADKDGNQKVLEEREKRSRDSEGVKKKPSDYNEGVEKGWSDDTNKQASEGSPRLQAERRSRENGTKTLAPTVAAASEGGGAGLLSSRQLYQTAPETASSRESTESGGGGEYLSDLQKNTKLPRSSTHYSDGLSEGVTGKKEGENINNEGRKDRVNEAENRLKLLTTPSNDETVLLSLTVSTDGTVPTSSPSSSQLFASSGYCSAVSDVDGSIDEGVNDNTHPLSTAVVTDGDVSVAGREATNISPESDWKTNIAGVTDSEINIVGTSDYETATVTDGEISCVGLSNAGGATDWKTSNTVATTGETHNITTVADSDKNVVGVTGVTDSVNNSRESDSTENTSPVTDTENNTVYDSDKNTAEGKTRVAGAVGPQTSSDNYNNSTTALDNYNTTSTGVDDREGYRTSDLHSDSRGVNDSWLQKGREGEEKGEIGEREGGEELGGAGKRSNQHATQLALVSQVTTHPSTSLRQDKNTRDGASPTPASTTTTQALNSSPTATITTDSAYFTATPTTVTSSSVDSVPTPTLTTDTHFSTATPTPTDLDYSETTPTTDSGYSTTATSSTLPHASCEQQVECFSEGVNTHISTEQSQQDFLNQNPTVAATEGEMERCPAAEKRFVDRSEQHLPPTTSTCEVSHRHRRHVHRLTTVEKTVTTEHTVRHRDHNDTSSSPAARGEGGSVNSAGVGLPPASCDFLTTTTDRTVSTTVREEDSEREETTTSSSTRQQPLIPGGRSSEEAGYHQPRPHSSNIASVEVTATTTTKGETVTPATSASTSTHLYLQPATQQQRQQTGYREGEESTPEMAGSRPVNTSYNNILDSLQEQLSLLSSEDVSFTSGYGSPRNSSQVWEYRDHAEATLPTTQRNSDRAYSDAEDKSDRVGGTSSVSFTLNRSYADRNSGEQQRAQIPESTSTSVDGQSVTDSKTDYLPGHGSSTFEAHRGDSDLRHARASQRLSTSWGEEALSTEDGGRGGEGSGNENRTLPPSSFSQRSNTSLWRRPASSSSSELDDSDGNYSSISTTDSSRHHHGPHSESDFPPSDGPEDYDNIHSFNDFVSGLKGHSTSDQPSLHHSVDMVAHDLRGSGFLRASFIQETILEADDESETADDEANTTGDTTLSSFRSSVHFSVPQSTPKMNYVSPVPQIKLWSTDVSELTASENRMEFSTPSPIHPLQDLSDRLSNISADLSYDLSRTMHDDSRLDLDLSYSRHSACSSPTPSDVSEGSVYSTSATAEVRKQAEQGMSFKSAELTPTHRVARRNLSSAFSAKTPSRSKKSQWVEEKIVLFQKLLNDFEWQSKTSEQRLLDDMISFETRGDNVREDVSQKSGEICDDLYRAFTRENQELRQNHVCPVIEDHMPAIRFKRFLRKKHNSKLKGNRTFRIRHRLDRLAETVSQSGGGKSVSEMDLSRLRSTPYSSYQSKLLSPSALRDRFGSDVFTDDTDVKKSFSSDSAYSTLSSATSRHISDLDSTYRSVCDSRGDVSSIATDVSMDENDKLRSLSDVFDQLDVCEGEIDSALLDRLQVGHYKADTL